jgi:hypothetical protein
MKETEREDYLEILEGWDKFKVIFWSGFCKKRFYVFDTWWNRGMATNIAFNKANDMTRKEVHKFYKENQKTESK